MKFCRLFTYSVLLLTLYAVTVESRLCKFGLWGSDCEKQCGKCLGVKCDINTGVCPQGCLAGYFGENCDDADRQKRQASGGTEKLKCANLEEKFKEMKDKLARPMEIPHWPIVIIMVVMSIITLIVHFHGRYMYNRRQRIKQKWLEERLEVLAVAKQIEKRRIWGEVILAQDFGPPQGGPKTNNSQPIPPAAPPSTGGVVPRNKTKT